MILERRVEGMKSSSTIVLSMGIFMLSACQMTDMKTGAVDVMSQAEREVVFVPLVLERDGYCLVGFGITYPEDVEPHARQIRINTRWSGDVVDYPLPIPPLGAPDRYSSNDDGTVTFSGMVNDSIIECDPELAARTLAIGPCVEGQCLVARFASNARAAELGIDEAVY
ncbi:hypothetical protein K1X12_14775 [Hyphomonas sp. WL0036]|uniref:hypothetical protein n=1 Tax=Hyphomonas sediminis TaxID=2866160 RepID=UPI001C80263C|nr:hypothetical protein [Hyphomonas sediminis]MBY9068173.1 hypothetical protein [Hyphomonas sediminis]